MVVFDDPIVVDDNRLSVSLPINRLIGLSSKTNFNYLVNLPYFFSPI